MSKADSVGTIGLDLVVNQNGFDKQMKGITSLAKKAGATLAAAFAVKKLVDFGQQCIELGSDLAEVQNVVDVTFPKMNKKIDEFAKNAATQFGLSETMAKRYAGTLGSMAEAFGFSEKEAADMAMTLTGLAGDVASFYNIDQDAAYTKLKAVFSGETESLKDLGIVMTQTALDQYALANGFGKTTAKMSEQEKVALRYSFVQKQLANATGDFSRTSDGWANQMRILNLQLDSIKANLGQGFINLFSGIVKQVNVLLGKLATLANSFKAFTELITGKKSEDSSMANMASDAGLVSDNASDAADNVASIGDSAKKAAKKLGSLASWDELNVRTDNSDSSDSSGSGSGGSIPGANVDYGKAADTGSTAFSKLGKIIDKIKNKFIELKNLFSKGFSLGFKSKGFEKIKEYLKSIGEDLLYIFTSPELLSAIDNLVSTGIYNLGRIAGSIASVGTSIATMLTGGIAKFLDKRKDFIKNKIIEIFDIQAEISTIYADFAEAIADIFTVFESDEAQQIVADFIDIFATSALEMNVLGNKIGRDLLDAITGPIIGNTNLIKTALEDTLKPISSVVSTISTAVSDTFSEIQKAYDEYVHPAFKNIRKGLTTILGKVLEGYSSYLAPVLSKIAKGVSELYNTHLKPLISNIVGFVGRIIDAVGKLFNFLSPIIGWIVQTIMSTLGPTITFIWDCVKTVIASISDSLNALIGFINDLIDFVVGIFTGDWKKAWGEIKKIADSIIDGIKNSFKMAFDWLKGIFSTIITFIKNGIKNTAEGVVTFLKSTWQVIMNVFSAVTGFFKNVFGGAWNAIKEIFSNPGKFFSNVWSGIKSVFGGVVGWFKDKFSAAWQAVKDVFSKGGKVFSGIKDGIASAFKSIVNVLITGLNKVIAFPFNKINGILNDIRNFDIPVIGKVFEGLWGQNPLPVPQIPKLAKGAVIPPRAPFLAMLGDQQRGTNIEAPLDTIKQAVKEIIDDNDNGPTEIRVEVYVEQNDQGVFKVVRTQAKEYTKRTGKPPFPDKV